MFRPIQVGDQTEESPITGLTPEGILIGSSQLILPVGQDQWQVSGLSEPHQATRQNLSGIPEINALIALNLPYQQILALCRSSKELSKLCSDESLWKRLVDRDFGLSRLKSPDQAYQQLYQYLIGVFNDIKLASQYIEVTKPKRAEELLLKHRNSIPAVPETSFIHQRITQELFRLYSMTGKPTAGDKVVAEIIKFYPNEHPLFQVDLEERVIHLPKFMRDWTLSPYLTIALDRFPDLDCFYTKIKEFDQTDYCFKFPGKKTYCDTEFEEPSELPYLAEKCKRVKVEFDLI